MKIGNKDKIYIFTRDNKKCFYCGKSLKYRQITLDHYLPLSKGGKNEVFNLVTCCRKCNKIKADIVPENFMETLLNLFIKAVYDGKIIGKDIALDNKILKHKLIEVERIEIMSDSFIFQSKTMRFYIKNGFVCKVIYLGKDSFT